MPATYRKYVFLVLLLAVIAAGTLGAWAWAGALFGALFLWLWRETRERQRFAFVAERKCRERNVALPSEAQGLAVSQTAALALVVEAGPTVSLLDLERGVLRFSRGFPDGALAMVARPDGRLLWAGERALHLTDAEGRDVAELGFEPPLHRQGYRVLLSADGGRAVLHTPWFIQAFDPELGSLGPRLRYEDAGHYMKYAVLSSDGARLYTAGALLLDTEAEDASGAAMEARWDAWDLRDGAWVNAWKQSNESYSNSHLRGLSLSADGSLLCAELYQDGYDLRFFRPDGAQVWKRAGEHPALSPDGQLVLWENPFDGVVLTRLGEKEKLFVRRFEERVRFKALAADGSALVLAGRTLHVLAPDGRTRWEAWLQNDPHELGLGPRGLLAASLGRRAGSIQLPWSA